MTKVKMCGLFRDEDIEFVNEIKPEYIGFVFYKKSHRYVNKETARRLKSKLDKNIKAVGVFVDEDISFITELIDEKIIDMIQLHGHEDSVYIATLRDILSMSFAKDSVQIIKAQLISTKEDVDKLSRSNSELPDYYLLDSGMGGGSSFDWNLVKELNRPVFLAGGLNPENVAEAIRLTSPFAVDVSSGIETDKVKNLAKMKRFIENVR